MFKDHKQSVAKLEGESRWWVVALILFSLLPQGLAVQVSGRTPNVLLFDFVLLIAIGWVVFEWVVGDMKFHPSDKWITRLFVGLSLCQVLSLLLNEQDVLRGFSAIKVSLFAYFSYFVITVLVRSKPDCRRATYSLVLWGGVIGLLLTFNFFDVWSVDIGPEASYVAKDEIGIGLGRSNYLAAILILVLPIGVATLYSHRGFRRLLFTLPVALMSLGLLITMSKGAFIALGLGSICAIPIMLKRGFNLRHSIVFLFLICTFFVLVPRDLLLSNLDMFSYRLATPDLDRVDLWNVAWQTFTKHSFLGVGPSAIYLYNQQFAIAVVDTHNFVLQELAELGIIGALPFFVIVATFVRRTYSLCAAPVVDESLRFLPVGLFVGLISTLVHGLVEPTFPGQQYAVVFWVCMAFVFVLTREQLQKTKVSPGMAQGLLDASGLLSAGPGSAHT
jgi:O-antigen ligase